MRPPVALTGVNPLTLLQPTDPVLCPPASEVFRQTALLESGRPVPQETRGFDEAKAETFKLRSKEDAPDYRYMPDPNLPPLLVDAVRGPIPFPLP